MVFGTDDGREAIVWVAELRAGTPARKLTLGGRNLYPIWSRDGTFIVFQSDRESDRGLFRQPADGSGTAERLTKADGAGEHRPDGWTADGRTLIFTASGGNADIWAVPLDGDRQPKPLIQRSGGSGDRQSAVSIDGRWLAYSSNEVNGQYEVFVQPLPVTGAKYQVSTEGGREPVWAPDGKHLIYNTAGGATSAYRFVEVEVKTQPTFSFGRPLPVRVEGALLGVTNVTRHYDVTPDGKQLLVLMSPSTGTDSSRQAPEQINVVLNWFEELKARVPVTK
jgi:Tol biopolymer transport system component